MLGAILVLIAMFVVGPIAFFMAGAAWSALMGLALADDADARAESPAE